MRTLLIVDDERNIRLGLKAMIEREFPDCYSFAFASHGEQALQVVRESAVDIVITDIRMPVMDGIELINTLHRSEHKPAVLVLSGYDDFKYAKEAIRCEVRDYLLKPIVREELFRTLRRVEQELLRMEELSNQKLASIRQREQYGESQLGYVLLHPGMNGEEIRHRLAGIGMEWMDSGFRVGLLRFSGREQNAVRTEISAAADALFQELPEPYMRQLVRSFDKDNQLAVIGGHAALFEQLKNKLSERPEEPFSIGLSERTTGMENVKCAFDQAGQALKYTFLQSVSVVAFEDIKHRSTDYTVPTETIKRMANLLGTGREQEMSRLLFEVLGRNTVNKYDIAYVEAVSKAMNELVFDKVFHVYGEESVIILKLYKKAGDLYNFRRFHDYFHTVESLLERLNEYIKTMKSVHIDHKEMKTAVAFIQANYRKDLNMAMVSNHVSLNYSYFSQAFKEYTGMSFVHYLKSLRIEKAKELLERTDHKVFEIGTMVGFENTKHFNRVFKEMEGVTPLEYRVQKMILS